MECVTCVCIWIGRRWWRWNEWMRLLGLGFTNTVGTGGVLDMCFGCGGVVGVGSERAGGLVQGLYGRCYVCLSCESRFYV